MSILLQKKWLVTSLLFFPIILNIIFFPLIIAQNSNAFAPNGLTSLVTVSSTLFAIFFFTIIGSFFAGVLIVADKILGKRLEDSVTLQKSSSDFVLRGIIEGVVLSPGFGYGSYLYILYLYFCYKRVVKNITSDKQSVDLYWQSFALRMLLCVYISFYFILGIFLIASRFVK